MKALTPRWNRLCLLTSSICQKFGQRYALFTNEQGGILDDLMVTRREKRFVRGRTPPARCKTLLTCNSTSVAVAPFCPLPDQALLALQGRRRSPHWPA